MTIGSLLGVLWLGCLAAATPGPSSTPSALAADHHMHIVSPAAVRRHHLLCAKLGPGECGGEELAPSTGADALAALDAAGIDRGVVLSMAYMAAAPELGETEREIASDARAENAYVVEQAAASGGRLVAFVSVNPNSASALDEIRYWARRGGAAGLKLHLTNSGFDFTSRKQVARLAAVFRTAAAARLPILVHLRSLDPEYGAREVGVFLEKVLPAARDDVVQIAHSGGWGGADRQALSALAAFAEAIRRDPRGTANLYFDMAVMPDRSTAPASEEAVSRYVALMRQIGLGRFLPASDWVLGTDLAASHAAVQRRLGLTEAEWQVLSGNVAPYLDRGGAARVRQDAPGDVR